LIASLQICNATAMPKSPIDLLRAVCLALPEAAEKEAWGDPTFRVRNKIFAMQTNRDGRAAVWVKAPEGSQIILVNGDPARYFVPPYVGHKGWVGIWLDDGPDWDEVTLQIQRSYRMIAPKRLAALVA
jgi:predicted DNA-binding protein (MmcQ/YjbR family)